MADRGWLETTYYQLGSDYRGNLSYLLSYMSQMGGWSILDYGLHFAADPTDYLRLGYASSLSSWALVNSGTKESGYGVLVPGQEQRRRDRRRLHAGADGPRVDRQADDARRVVLQRRRRRRLRARALRTHATIVTRDPIFGEFAYGGIADTRRVVGARSMPRDGLRVRFHVIRDDQRLHMELDHDGYAKEQPIVVADDLSRVQFTLENRTGGAHQTGLTIAGLPAGTYSISVDRKIVSTINGGAEAQKIQLPVAAGASSEVVIVRER